MAEQLWSDERIAKVTHGLYVSADRVTVISIETMRSFMQMVSDDLQAALDAANQRIAELEAQAAWEPLPIEGGIIEIPTEGNQSAREFAVHYSRGWGSITLPDNIRLCRRKEA